jgi:Arc/MetJ-type ribon-helix-helix transcriptional regulator
MTIVVSVALPDDLKSAIDRRVAEGRVQSDADSLRRAARFCAEELEAEERASDDDLTSVALAGTADAETGHYSLVASKSDAGAVRDRIRGAVRAELAKDP